MVEVVVLPESSTRFAARKKEMALRRLHWNVGARRPRPYELLRRQKERTLQHSQCGIRRRVSFMNYEQLFKPLQILAISGSLRAASSNTALLQAAQRLAPEGVTISMFDGIGDLPHFNPDLDNEDAPSSVQDFRARLRQADGVLICSPEYAHGVPGTLKNALDWIVGSGELMEKPVALLKASSHGGHAQASLQETLSVMMAQVAEEASLVVALGSNKVVAADLANDEVASRTLRSALEAFVLAD